MASIFEQQWYNAPGNNPMGGIQQYYTQRQQSTTPLVKRPVKSPGQIEREKQRYLMQRDALLRDQENAAMAKNPYIMGNPSMNQVIDGLQKRAIIPGMPSYAAMEHQMNQFDQSADVPKEEPVRRAPVRRAPVRRVNPIEQQNQVLESVELAHDAAEQEKLNNQFNHIAEAPELETEEDIEEVVAPKKRNWLQRQHDKRKEAAKILFSEAGYDTRGFYKNITPHAAKRSLGGVLYRNPALDYMTPLSSYSRDSFRKTY